MKKILFILGICFLIALPAASAFSIPQLRSLRSNMTQINSEGDAPMWAAGNFTGEWGVNIWGHDWITIGDFSGYYGSGFLRNIKISRFQIEYNESGSDNGTILHGIFFGPYLLGMSIEVDTGNTTNFVGLGGYNETSAEFHWRIMGLHGPTLFMRGTYAEF